MSLVGKYFHILVKDDAGYLYAGFQGQVLSESKEGIFLIRTFCKLTGAESPGARLFFIKDMILSLPDGSGWIFYDSAEEMHDEYKRKYFYRPKQIGKEFEEKK